MTYYFARSRLKLCYSSRRRETWEPEIRRKAAGKRHFSAPQLFQCSEKNTPHGRLGKGPGSIGPRFPAGLPFPVPEILEFVALGNSGTFFPAIFPGLSRNFPPELPHGPRKQPQPSRVFGNVALQFPNLLFLAFLVFLAFFLFKEFLAILSVFPFFPKDFRGSASRRNPCLFGGFPCCFPKRQGKEDQGFSLVAAPKGVVNKRLRGASCASSAGVKIPQVEG